jgi:hypothetical protein
MHTGFLNACLRLGLIAALGHGFGAVTLLAESPLEESRQIDAMLANAWKARGIVPRPIADDETILRRLYLDIAGRIPTLGEAREFLDSPDPGKRSRLIDHLLASEGFASHHFNFWADLLRISDRARGPIATEAYAEWLKRALRENRPYDEIVRQLVGARGGSWDNGAIGFHMRDDNRLDHLAYLSQLFLGTQIMCAQCHDHPFDKWTQLDFYRLYAYTSGTITGGGYYDPFAGEPGLNSGPTAAERALPRADSLRLREIVKDALDPLRYSYVKWDERRLPRLPHDYQYDNAKPGDEIAPRVLFGALPEPTPGEPRIDTFARWLTAPENPRFTTVIANRLWARVFGRGLIEPLDDFTDATTASHPELMDYLTHLLIAKRYSMKSYLRVLFHTETYQRAVDPTGQEPADFVGPELRRLTAEQVWDSLVTLMRGNIDGMPSPEDARINEYLGDVSQLMDKMREMGPAAVLAATAVAGERTAAAKLARREMRRKPGDPDTKSSEEQFRQATMAKRNRTGDIFSSIVDPETAASIMARFNPNFYEHQRRRSVSPEAEHLNRDEMRALSTLAGGGLSDALRASELSAPTPPGHFLRIFGQADRENIANFSTDSTVPQALARINGPLFAALTHHTAVWRREMEKSPGDPARVLFLSLLSRNPHPGEIALFEKVRAERGEKALDDLAYALLNGAEFLFNR